MTKIELYKKAKSIADNIARSVACTLGRDDSSNDKHVFDARFVALKNEDWTPMTLEIGCRYGYYGSSSGYSATSKELGGYLAKAIENHAALLLDAAAKYAADDAEKARKEAEDEARSVLGETTQAA